MDMENADVSLGQEAPTGRAAKTRAAILTAARAEFEHRGYEGARGPEIAKAAGVAEGTVFLHFKNKVGLLSAVMVEFYRTVLMREAAVIADAIPEPLDQLKALLTHFATTTLAHWPIIKVFRRQGRYYDDRVEQTFYELNRAYTERFVVLLDRLKAGGHLRADLPTSLMRDMLFGTFEHYALSRTLKGVDSLDPQAMVREVMALFLDGAHRSDTADIARLERKLDTLLAR